MGILSKSALNSIKESAVREKSYSWLNESVNARTRLKKFGEVTVFL